MTRMQKLELTWVGKDERPRLEPRILLEDPKRLYHATKRVTEHDQFDNRLIFGDNLLAPKALEQEFTATCARTSGRDSASRGIRWKDWSVAPGARSPAARRSATASATGSRRCACVRCARTSRMRWRYRCRSGCIGIPGTSATGKKTPPRLNSRRRFRSYVSNSYFFDFDAFQALCSSGMHEAHGWYPAAIAVASSAKNTRCCA